MGFGRQIHALPQPQHAPVAIPRNYPLSVTITGSIPAATVGTSYSLSLSSIITIAGGVGPYTWSIISGSLPPGLTMSTSGNITGTPTTQGTFNFTVQVVNPLGNVGSVNLGVSL
jgi:Putative Ig domain